MNCCLFNILANLHNFTNFVDAGAISKEEKYIQRWPGLPLDVNVVVVSAESPKNTIY